MRSRIASSNNTYRLAGVVCLLLLGAMIAPGVHAERSASGPAVASAPRSFAALLDVFKDTPGFEARFEEEKFLALLAAPLRSSGRLYFASPSMLLRRVESPRPQDILVADGHVRISDATSTRVIDLAARGEVRPLVESMIWIFTGNRASLEETYHVDYRTQGDSDEWAVAGPDRWEVRLTPKRAPLTELIRELRVRGAGPAADTLELIEKTGDRTLTRIFDVEARREFDEVERRELFGPR